MMSRNFRVVAVVLVLTLGMTGAASALGPRAETRSGGDFVAWIVSLVSQTGAGLRSIWDNAGAGIDPLGGPTANGGGYIDPNGGPTTNGGGYIDPNGG
ncbi:MAG TPA: hypothetical protein VH394_27250 [Thermoanaerobaculia bacterium]|nr:hypothetical protein [Thermoanaerobaculia bacterium]